MRKLLISVIALLAPAFAGAGDFFLGADISGTTADEARGHFTRNEAGEVVETTRLMRDYGLNAIRLRVWVNPKDGFSSPEDILILADRARELDMPVMIDFHYSDWWADPGKQNIPDAWKNLDIEGMEKALYDHTVSTLSALRDHGVDVRWVQIGNETTNGLLWPLGHLPEEPDNYAALTKAGYEAAKSVYPDTQVIVHLDNGFDRDLYIRIFDSLRDRGVKWDMIGMSVYPYWAMQSGRVPDAETTINESMANIRDLKERYGTDVMIVETGMDVRTPEESKRQLAMLIRKALDETDGACRGVWYWAPEMESDPHYHLGAFVNGQPTIIMDAFREAAAALNP